MNFHNLNFHNRNKAAKLEKEASQRRHDDKMGKKKADQETQTETKNEYEVEELFEILEGNIRQNEEIKSLLDENMRAIFSQVTPLYYLDPIMQ